MAPFDAHKFDAFKVRLDNDLVIFLLTPTAYPE